MAAILATIKGKVLIQLEDREPVEVGTVDIPIHASSSRVATVEETEAYVQAWRDTAARRSILCALGIHRSPRYVNAHTQAPAPIRCERCQRTA